MRRLLRQTVALCACALLIGCDEGRERPPRVTAVFVNAAASYPDLCIYRGAGPGGLLGATGTPVDYLGIRTVDVDADTYNFHLRLPNLAGCTSLQPSIHTFTETLEPNNSYLQVLIEAGGDLDELLIAQPPFDLASANTEISVVHATEAAGSIDVYVEPAGTDLASVTPRGTLSFRESSAPVATSPGDYVVTVTESGAVANVLFTSFPFSLEAGRSHALIVAGGAGAGTSELVLIAAGPIASTSVDANAGSGVRVINGAGDRGARDVFAAQDFTAPLVAGTAFATASEFATTASGETTLSITPAGNVGAVELELTPALVSGSIYSLVIAGDSSALEGAVSVDDHRVRRDQARIQFINLVNHYELLDYFFVAEGTDISSAAPTFQLATPGVSPRSPFVLGTRELTIRDNATKAVIYGPVALSFPAAGTYTIVAVDNADGTTADVVLLDDFQ